MIKPCPFCGGEAAILKVEPVAAAVTFHAACSSCGARTAKTEKAGAAAILWNTRVSVHDCEQASDPDEGSPNS